MRTFTLPYFHDFSRHRHPLYLQHRILVSTLLQFYGDQSLWESAVKECQTAKLKWLQYLRNSAVNYFQRFLLSPEPPHLVPTAQQTNPHSSSILERGRTSVIWRSNDVNTQRWESPRRLAYFCMHALPGCSALSSFTSFFGAHEVKDQSLIFLNVKERREISLSVDQCPTTQHQNDLQGLRTLTSPSSRAFTLSSTPSPLIPTPARLVPLPSSNSQRARTLLGGDQTFSIRSAGSLETWVLSSARLSP